MEEVNVKIDGKEYPVQIEEVGDKRLRVVCKGDVFDVETTGPRPISETHEGSDSVEAAHDKSKVTSPLPGTIFSLCVKEGDEVKEGDALVKLIAMKMENEILALRDGKVRKIHVKKDQSVNKGDLLVELE